MEPAATGPVIGELPWVGPNLHPVSIAIMLIHQITLGKRLPDFHRKCLASWDKLKGRDVDIVSWTDRNVKAYLADCPPTSVRTLYERARNYGEASDILRMAITYSFGGLYVDWDVLLVDPDRFLAVVGDVKNCDCMFIADRFTKEPNFRCVYDNSLFYMKRGNPLALAFISQIEENYARQPLPSTSYLTGPLALTSFLDSRPRYKDHCRMVAVRDIYALDYEDVLAQLKDQKDRDVLMKSAKTDGAPAIHFWTNAWIPERNWFSMLLQTVLRSFRMRSR